MLFISYISFIFFYFMSQLFFSFYFIPFTVARTLEIYSQQKPSVQYSIVFLSPVMLYSKSRGIIHLV